jgi:hypothetical protein
MQNMISLLEPTLGAQITITLDCDDSPQLINVDIALLESAILNLAANARDAMPDGGSLLIRCNPASFDECCRAKIDAAKGAVVIEVSDDGVGMDDEVQQRLFDPFFTTKAPDEGTGLGLATVFTFVEQSGGIVEVRSALGIGTIFTIILPSINDSSGIGMGRQPNDVQDSIEGLEILLVEDDPSVRSLLTEQLRSMGHAVVPAVDATEGEAVFGLGRGFDLLLTDVGLPDRSGPELAARIRQRDRDVSVVFVTGHIDAAAERVLKSVDRSTMLRKPFSISALAKSIEHAIELTGGRKKRSTPSSKKAGSRFFG